MGLGWSQGSNGAAYAGTGPPGACQVAGGASACGSAGMKGGASESADCGGTIFVSAHASGASSTSSGSSSSGSLCSSDSATHDTPTPVEQYARDSHQVATQDGWHLHILHVYDPQAGQRSASGGGGGGAGAPRPRHPVLMVPGLASSGEHTFDLLPDHSLVNALVARGHDVWVADLRGNGRSQKPRLLDARTWWTVDDHFLQDVPAVLRYVLDTSGARQVHWVGHSMGGMLAVGLHSQQHPLAGALRSITLLASGCFGAGSWHHALRPLISVLTRCGFPAGVVAATIGALSGTAAALRPLEALFYWPCNTPPAAARKLMSDGFHFIPVGVIRQFMGSLNSRHGLSAADGSFLYANPHTLALARVPIMALSGDWDLFCPASGAQRTLAMFGGDAKRFVCFGPAHGTGRRHYGHFDIVCGKDAGSEVYPHVYAWLAEHDGVLSGQRPRGGSAAAPQ